MQTLKHSNGKTVSSRTTNPVSSLATKASNQTKATRLSINNECMTLNGIVLQLIYKGIALFLSRDNDGNLRLHDNHSFYGFSSPWSNSKFEPVIRLSYWLEHGLKKNRAYVKSDDAAVRQMKNYLSKIESHKLGERREKLCTSAIRTQFP